MNMSYDIGMPELLPEEDLFSFLQSADYTQPQIEQIPLHLAYDRVLARSLISPRNAPPTDNSAMDGYAVCIHDCISKTGNRLKVSQRIPAGLCGKPLQPGTAARIFTGAPIPANADAVVLQEN